MNTRWLQLALVLTSLGLAGRALAESEAETPEESPPSDVGGIKGRSTTVLAERWLNSGDPQAREKALKRLGSHADAQGVELLIRAVQPNGAANTARLRLLALRSLARYLDDPAVRRALVTLMSGAGQAPEAGDDPLERLVRDSAAMALAASEQRDALTVLGKSLRQGGPTGRAAAEALIAHPPKDLTVLAATPSGASVNLVNVLGALHDQRAFNALRSYVTRGNVEVRSRATIVLTQMGHMETIGLARHWLRAESTAASQRFAATRVLAMTRTEDSAKYVAELLENEDHRVAAIQLAQELPDPRLAPALGKLLSEAPAEQRAELFSILGRVGGVEAVALLKQRLSAPEDLSQAAYALALEPSPSARAALEAGLSKPATRRSCARALVMRATALGDVAPTLVDALTVLLAAKDPGDRATGAFGLSTLDQDQALRLLGSKDRDVVIAAARTAQRGPRAVAAARRLVGETDDELSLALSASLADDQARALVPTHRLHQLIQTGSVAASLAAGALAARLDDPNGPHVEELLHSPSRHIRAEFALGLGRAPTPEALGLLRQLYEFEVDSLVRRAIVTALSQRPEQSRRHLLLQAVELDPDPIVRQLASLASRGQRLARPPEGARSFWLELMPSQPGAARTRWPVVVQGPRGHTLLALPDPDGFVGLTGLDSGAVSYLLAEPAR